MIQSDAALAWANANKVRSLETLKHLVSFASVSSQPANARAVQQCAQWLADYLRAIGLERVEVFRTERHPIVFAEWRGRPGAATILIYGHYDVQPADPLSAWKSPPFEPIVRGDNLYGRGASDDKGQFFAHVAALEAYLQMAGGPPVNIVCLFEGEEEIGSPNLPPFLNRYRAALKADVAVVSDTRMIGPERPAIAYGLRGKLAMEVEVRRAGGDLHSGAFGGAVYNPLQVLCEIAARLHTPEGHINIPGFYSQVRSPMPGERQRLREGGPSNAEMLRDAGGAPPWGEPAYSLYERTVLRPAITIMGISSGYEGPGVQDAIPASATMRLGLRLVPDQVPDDIARLVAGYIEKITPTDLQTRLRILSSSYPVLLPRNHPAMSAASSAYRTSFGRSPVFLRSGGSIPVVSLLQRTLSIPTVLMGFALSSDRMHAPNEKFYLPNFYRGIATSIRFLAAMGALAGGQQSRAHTPISSYRAPAIR